MTELYVNDQAIDLYDGFQKSLNYSIGDIRNPDKRNTSYSKTIVIPGSKTNDIIFTHIFEISKESIGGSANFTPDFNPNKKAYCQLYTNSLLQFSGYIQLLRINITDDKKEYEIACYGSFGNMFATLGDGLLTDLDFSEYDHSYNKTNQKNSWQSSIIKNGSAYDNFPTGNPNGHGYVYPYIFYGKTQFKTTMRVIDFFPAIYVYEYLFQIQKQTGFTFQSAFFESDFFKRLIIPFSGDSLPVAPIEATRRGVYANTNSEPTINISTTVPSIVPVNDYTAITSFKFTNDSTGLGNDYYNQYNPSTGELTIKREGRYKLTVRLDILFTNTTNAHAQGVIVRVKKRSTNTYLAVTGRPPGTIIRIPDTNTSTPTAGSATFGIFFNEELVIGEVYTVDIIIRNTAGAITTLVCDIQDSSYIKLDLVPTPIIEGSDMFLNSCVPRDIKIKDFFMSLVKAFNLFILPDKTNDKNLIIEPAPDFYNQTIIDWSDKLDRDSKIEIRPVSEIEGKNYIYSYKEDKDFYNEDFNIKKSMIYGSKSVIIDNDFISGTKDNTLIFSATPTIGVSGSRLVFPAILKKNDDGSVTTQAANIRLLYYGGLVTAGPPWSYVETGSTTNEFYYAYCGHFDDPFNPTLDLNFDVMPFYYWNLLGLTNNNLYNKYHKQFIEEITNKDSKIIRAYFRLRPVDIYMIDFRNIFQVNGINYRLNQILDYDPDKDDVCIVELSKIKSGFAFTPETLPAIYIDLSNIIQGGVNEVRALTATSPIQIVEGGQDQVANPFPAYPIQIINGGQ